MKTFKIAIGWRIFIYVTLPPFILLFSFLPIQCFIDGKMNSFYFWLGIALLVIPLLIYGLIDTYKSKIILTESYIKSVSALGTKKLLVSEVKGFKEDENYIHIIPLSKEKKKIKIAKTVGDLKEVWVWVQHQFINLDFENEQQEAAAVLANQELGSSEEERESKLKTAKNVAKALKFTSYAILFFTIFIIEPYELAVLSSVLMPILALLIVPFFKGLIKVNEKKGSAYPSILQAILMPTLGLALRVILDFNIFELSNLWMPSILFTIALFIYVFSTTDEFKIQDLKSFGYGLAIVIIFFFYSSISILSINCFYDQSTPTEYQTEIIKKSISKGKTTTYNFELTPWGDLIEPETVNVSEDFYNSKNKGNTVTVLYMEGLFDIPWLIVLD